MKTCGSKGADNWGFKHGLSHSPTYNTWHSMRSRCGNKRAADFYRYGGRGIKITKKWLKFDGFLKDMGVRPPGKTLDRIDVNGNYCKSNCRWADKKTQHRNTRTNKIIYYRGEKRPMCEWCDLLGLNYRAVRLRIYHGMSPEQAFNQKLRITRRTVI